MCWRNFWEYYNNRWWAIWNGLMGCAWKPTWMPSNLIDADLQTLVYTVVCLIHRRREHSSTVILANKIIDCLVEGGRYGSGLDEDRLRKLRLTERRFDGFPHWVFRASAVSFEQSWTYLSGECVSQVLRRNVAEVTQQVLYAYQLTSKTISHTSCRHL